MTEEEKAIRDAVEAYSHSAKGMAYYQACDVYDPEMSYEEYVVHIFQCLMMSSWRYTAEHAAERIRHNKNYIRECYEAKQTVIDVMTEIGYSCG